jgi:CelD/BcsL family acetyltransferase involved in cellulose biosynthesis
VPAAADLVDRLPPNAKLRSQLRQARHRLAERGVLRFYREPTAGHEALERFYRLEAGGWKGQQGSAILCHASTRSFYNEMAASAARFGYFSLYMLEFQGRLIAAHYSLTHGGRCYSPKVTYDEEFRQFAPGHLIVEKILRDCAARGIRGFDITGPNDDWKMKWTSETLAVHHHLVFRGKLGRVAHVLRYRIRPALADLVRRWRNGGMMRDLPVHERDREFKRILSC